MEEGRKAQELVHEEVNGVTLQWGGTYQQGVKNKVAKMARLNNDTVKKTR